MLAVNKSFGGITLPHHPLNYAPGTKTNNPKGVTGVREN